MDPAGLEALKTAAFTVLGVIWQKWRVNPAWPDWLAWVVIPSSCVLAWLWATPGWYGGDWRMTLLSLYAFVMAARGSASTAADAGIVPRVK